MFAPIIFFAYNRPYHTYQSLKALSNNKESIESDLIVYIDGPKVPSQTYLINYVEDIVKKFSECFKTIKINKSPINMGCAFSQRTGISEVLNQYQSVIVLEDDIVVSKFFLKYMNEGLKTYRFQKKIWHINGYNFPIKSNKKDCYLSRVMFCWGWATWRDRWTQFLKDPLYHDPFFLKDIFDEPMRKELDLNSNVKFFYSQIESNIRGNVTWAIFWYSYIFLNNGLCLTPYFSMTKNIGHDGSGINCKSNKKIQSEIISLNSINKFPNELVEDKNTLKDMKKYLIKTYSLKSKIFRVIQRKFFY